MLKLRTLALACYMLLLMSSMAFSLQAINSSENLSQQNKECIVIKDEEGNYGLLMQLVGIVISASIIIWQIDRQHKNNIALQKENFKDKLKLEIYQKLGEKIRATNEKIICISTFVKMTPINVESYLHSSPFGVKNKPVKERINHYSESYHCMCNSIIELITTLEEYEIVSPSFRVFRMAIMSSNYDLDEIHLNLHRELLACLPIDVSAEEQEKVGGSVVVPFTLTPARVESLKKLSAQFDEKIMDLTCYSFDLQVETQNMLLGGIFEHRVQGRTPNDSKYVTIKTDQASLQKLEKYFLEETPWGKNWQRAKSSE